MATVAPQQSKPPSRRSWANTNSHHLFKAYDKSPKHSPPQTPSISRNNSTTSINSISSVQSEPTWRSPRHSEPSSPVSTRTRLDSNASQTSTLSTASHKKSGFKSLFGHKDSAEKEKKKKPTEKIVLGSKHAAAVRTKLAVDPEYRKLAQEHHDTAGATEHVNSIHSMAYLQEHRYPHSGPHAIHGKADLPELTRIESDDEDDLEIDPWEAERRDWNETHPDLPVVTEIVSHGKHTSPHDSPSASPSASRDASPSPSRTSSIVRPSHGSKHNSIGGGYHKDDVTGRWRKTPPGGTPPSMTPIMPKPDEMTPDMLAKSLAERLNTQA